VRTEFSRKSASGISEVRGGSKNVVKIFVKSMAGGDLMSLPFFLRGAQLFKQGGGSASE
jgi:hypothetical protein